MSRYPSIVVLTGAGVSAESGIKTFRDHNGLWENHRLEDVCTPEAFTRNPALVQQFYNARRRQLVAEAHPNPAHLALADFERAFTGNFTLVTQNVDDLHERAGSTRVLHMHGELRRVRCTHCGARLSWDGDLLGATECPSCGQPALRPDIVWFGEYPYGLEEIDRAVSACEMFVAIGTSGSVYPAAAYVAQAASHGARTVELNLVPSEVSSYFDDVRVGPATELVPAWVGEMRA